MRALASAIRRFSDECAQVDGRIERGATLELEHIDAAVNALDDALVAIRTLDLEILEGSDRAYTAKRKASPRGMVVRALTGPRNSAVHHPDAVDPDLARAVGPVERGTFIVFPKWKLRAELPKEMFQVNGKNVNAYVEAYDHSAAGRLVLDTLMDAFAFFDSCDGRLSDRDGTGQLIGFPLPPLPIADSYYRLAPDWPDTETVHHQIRQQAALAMPAGEGREITGRLTVPSGVVYCGYTIIHGGRHAFTEAAEQIQRDIQAGFHYFVTSGDGPVSVGVQDEELILGADLFDNGSLVDWTDRDDEVWVGLWGLCASDAHYYRRQRLAP